MGLGYPGSCILPWKEIPLLSFFRSAFLRVSAVYRTLRTHTILYLLLTHNFAYCAPVMSTKKNVYSSYYYSEYLFGNDFGNDDSNLTHEKETVGSLQSSPQSKSDTIHLESHTENMDITEDSSLTDFLELFQLKPCKSLKENKSRTRIDIDKVETSRKDRLPRSLRRKSTVTCKLYSRRYVYLEVREDRITQSTDQCSEYTNLRIFALGPNYIRIQGTKTGKFIHMDDLGQLVPVEIQNPEQIPSIEEESIALWREGTGYYRKFRLTTYHKEMRNGTNWYLTASDPRRRRKPIQYISSRSAEAQFWRDICRSYSCS